MLQLKGKDLIRNPYYNKGTAFTMEERKKYGLIGLLPNKVRTIDEQKAEILEKMKFYQSDYEKFKYLLDVYNENRTLFYCLLKDQITELLPVIYTPSIANAVIDFNEYFQFAEEAVFLDVEDTEGIRDALINGSEGLDEIRLMVITDGEGVLGIGDWGVQAAPIVVGKMMLYTIAAGIHPRNMLPVVIDAGTDNERLLESPHYMGAKRRRIRGEQYEKFIECFIREATDLFPNVLFHWEDFGRENANEILKKYRNQVCTFNDDIQGTGGVINASVSSVCRVTGRPLKEQRILIYGAGSAGIGIADQLRLELEFSGCSYEEACKRIYVVDRYGLCCEYTEGLSDGQRRYARSSEEFPRQLTDLTEIVEVIRPSILIGCSGQAGSFTEDVVRKMAMINERPAIFPISNPTNLSEATPDDILHWSDGRALVVTGSPFEPVEYNGITYSIGQANNALLFPGI